ncbi:glycosyltransferase family 87 protein [Ruegeria arenilitoris]|uniref:glycosyltransferase family 87 protein n=1 Tax=Ruegeria arenilitoris TaxID=1173585 RepID=UPI00148073A8|nr:glycosyltransferase family 87 protein [Ruegeria arenilitoris]
MKQAESQDRGSSDDVRRRLAAFSGRRSWQAGILVPALVLIFCTLFIIRNYLEVTAAGELVAQNDFRVFWAAARLALEGSPLDAFDERNLIAVHGFEEELGMRWLYPPSFLALLSPLGALSYFPAWIVFNCLSVLAILIAIRPFAAGITPVWLSFGLAPAYLPSLLSGQTSLIWAAGLLVALAAHQRNQPILAGIVIGILTLKPQLGIMIPFALLACGAWRTIIAATATTLVIAGIGTLIYGVEYWSALTANIELHYGDLRLAIADKGLMASTYSALMGLGIPEPIAMNVQWVVTGLSALAVFIAWRSPNVGFDLRAATLVMAICMSSAYFWFYETALLAPAALFLMRSGVVSKRHWGVGLLFLMWLGIGPATLSPELMNNGPIRLIVTPVMVAGFAVCLFAVFKRAIATPPPQDVIEDH